MKFPFPFKPTQITTAASSWPWPTCATVSRTNSFRADTAPFELATATPLSPHRCCTPSPESAVMSGVRSERLFFEPGATSSILEGGGKAEVAAEAVVIESRNPFVDFRVSMEEMVEAFGVEVRDWEFLEELLQWYLKVNEESNHGYIVGAFVDLLASAINDGSSFSFSASSSSSAATKCSFTSPLSFSFSSTPTLDYRSQ